MANPHNSNSVMEYVFVALVAFYLCMLLVLVSYSVFDIQVGPA